MTTKEGYAEGAFNHAAGLLVDMENGRVKNHDEIAITEHLHAQTHAIMAVGYLLEAILEELRSR